MDKNAKIFVAGIDDIIGTGFLRYFEAHRFSNVISELTCDVNLVNQDSVRSLFEKVRPEYVFLAHVKSGGILANINYPAEFIYENLQIQSSIIHLSYQLGVKKLLFLGSSCVYPKDCPQPMKEEYLLTGELEKTNEAYAIAKIAGIKMCQSYNKQYGTHFISVIPATVYGPQDCFDIEKGHVMASLIAKFHDAMVRNEPNVVVWGTGKPRREFMYVDDVVDACIFLMDNYEGSEVINIGCGEDIPIEDLARLIADVVGYKGKLVLDSSKLDGVFRKLLDNGRIRRLGWFRKTDLCEGIRLSYGWYKDNHISSKTVREK